MRKTIGSLIFGAMLVLPLTVKADDHDRDDRNSHSQRYYDSSHKDYHEWNDQEQRDYDRYLNEHHRKHQDFGKASKHQQQDYWKWRHEHNDNY